MREALYEGIVQAMDATTGIVTCVLPSLFGMQPQQLQPSLPRATDVSRIAPVNGGDKVMCYSSGPDDAPMKWLPTVRDTAFDSYYTTFFDARYDARFNPRFVDVAGDTMTGGLTISAGGATIAGGVSSSGNLSVGAGAQIQLNYSGEALRFQGGSGEYMSFFSGATRTGYMQANGTSGIILNSEQGPLTLASSNGAVNLNSSLNAGVPSVYGSTYNGLNWGGNYLIMTDGTSTFVSTPSTGGLIYLRAGVNGSYQLQLNANGNHLMVGNLDHQGYNVTSISVVRALQYAFTGGDTDTWIDNPADGTMRLVVNGGVPFEISAGYAACSVSASQGYTNGLRLYSITNGDHAIRWRGDIDGVEIIGHGDVRVTLTATGYFFDLNNNGNAYASNGVWANASSVKLKENIDDLSVERAIRTVRGLRPVTFDWRDGRSIDQVGFIAEWTQEVAPYACAPEIDGQTPAAIDYGRITPALTRVLQHVLDRLDRLEQKETS